MWEGQGQEAWVKVLEGWQVCVLGKFQVPVFKNLQLTELLENFLLDGIFYERDGVRETILDTNIPDFLEPGLG